MIEVVCGIIEDGEGRFLACRRPKGKHLGGLWEFPGGKVDPGESLPNALVRELREELAIDVSVGEALDPVDWDYGSTSIRLHPFLCRIVGGELQPHEHDAVSWCAPDDLDSLEWAPADVPILASLRHRVGKRPIDSPVPPAKVPDR